MSNLQLLLNDINYQKPSLSVVAGDFNSTCSSWWSNDINTTEGLIFFSLTSSNGFSQLIHDRTHIQANSSSCIDLVFSDQPNLSVNSGVHASLHPNCHHQIVHSSFKLNIYYLPPYQRLIWDYKKADANIIRKALDTVNWKRLFDSKKINEQVIALNETILYVTNKYITIDDKDPVWMNENIKSKIKTKIVLNGQTSSLRPVLAGVPQGSILGPLLFPVYINDLPDGLKSNAKLFADDTSLFIKV